MAKDSRHEKSTKSRKRTHKEKEGYLNAFVVYEKEKKQKLFSDPLAIRLKDEAEAPDALTHDTSVQAPKWHWLDNCGSKYETSKRNMPLKSTGMQSLKEICVRVAADHHRSLTAELLKMLPGPSARILWKQIVARGYDSLRIYRLFVQSCTESKVYDLWRPLNIKSFQPDLVKEINRCDRWLVTLDINVSPQTTTKADLLSLLHLDTLAGLKFTVNDSFSERSPGVLDDSVLAQYGAAMSRDKRWPMLRVFVLVSGPRPYGITKAGIDKVLRARSRIRYVEINPELMHSTGFQPMPGPEHLSVKSLSIKHDNVAKQLNLAVDHKVRPVRLDITIARPTDWYKKSSTVPETDLQAFILWSETREKAGNKNAAAIKAKQHIRRNGIVGRKIGIGSKLFDAIMH